MVSGNLQHSAIRETLRDYIAEQIAPNIADWEKQGRLPIHDLVKGLSDIGCFGLRYPIEDKGQGLDLFAHLAFAEEIGKIRSGGVGMALTIHGDMVLPMIDAGMRSTGQRARYLGPALTGQKIYSHAISEKGAGSDPSAIATEATKVDGGYILSGAKAYISLASISDMHCVLARMPKLRFPFNMILLMVDTNAPGVKVTPTGKMMGNHCCPTADIILDKVFVPEDARIGDEGMGFVLQMRQFVEERVISAARAVSSSTAIIDETIQHCSERKMFGGALLDLQSVSHKLVTLKSEATALRAFIYDTAGAWHRDENFQTQSCAVKLLSNRLARKAGGQCLKLQGASGYSSGSNAERFYRDGRLYAISTGSDEAMQMAIAKVAGGPLDDIPGPVSLDKGEVDYSQYAGSSFRQTLDNLGRAGVLQPCFGDNWFSSAHSIIEATATTLAAAHATSLLTHIDVGTLLLRHGSDEIKAAWLPGLVTGELTFSLAITEAGAGSDFNEMTTTATQGEDGTWKLNGQKSYITNGAVADGYVVLARTPSPHPLAGYSLFVVPKDDSVTREHHATLGNQGCLGNVSFSNTHVVNTQLIGRPGQGGLLVQQHLAKERYFIALRCFALGRGSLKRTAHAMNCRSTFGAPLSTRQALQFRLADFLAEMLLLRSQLLALAPDVEQRSAALGDIAAAKFRANDLLERLADFELQMSAGDGYCDDHAASRLYRDGIGLSIAGGSDGILQDMQARSLKF